MAYRSDLRDLNEINYARFEAKLDHRIAESGECLRQEVAELRAEMRLSLVDLRSELIKWMFLFWAGTTLVMIAAIKF